MTPIPYSITYYVRKRLIRKIAWVVLATAALAVLFSLYGREIFGERAAPAFIAVVSVLLCLVPFFASGLPKRLLDRSFEGVVKEIKSEVRVKYGHRGGRSIYAPPRNVTAPTGASRQVLRIHHYFLLVETDDGKLRRVSVADVLSGNPISHLYAVGDCVGHLAGTTGVYLIKAKNVYIRHCIICDSHGSADDTSCNCCGMPYVIPQ